MSDPRAFEQAYAGAKCKSCGTVAAIAPLPGGKKIVNWFRSDWKAEKTCPSCGARNHFTSKDLAAYEGPVSDGISRH